MKAIMFPVLALAAALSPAHAGTDGEVLKKAGLLGSWAFNCAKAPDAGNAHLVYEAPAKGAPTEHVSMGQLERVSTISNVVQLDGGKVKWTLSGQAGDLAIVNLVEGDKLRTWSSSGDEGAFIADGKFVGGDVTPWFNRCKAPRK